MPTRPLLALTSVASAAVGAAFEDAAKADKPMRVEANFIVAEGWLRVV
jgi:hypothetical protein